MNTGPAGNKMPDRSKSSDEAQQRGAASQPAAGAEPGDEILRAIGELQSGLGGLRALQEQTVKLGEELAAKRAAMAAEHTRLASLRQEVASEKAAADALKKELAAGQKELAARQSQIEEAAEKIVDLRRELEEGKAEVATAREELAAERKRVEAMRSETKAGRAREADGKVAAAEARVTEVNGQLARLTKRLESEEASFNARLSEAAAERAGLEARLASLESELAEARSGKKGVEDLKDRLALTEQGREDAERRLAEHAGVAADMMTWNARRTDRLRRYRSLLQGEARKLVTAKEALSKRQRECEAMLAQRTKLNQALEAVKVLEQKFDSKKARTAAAAAVLLAVGTVSLILAGAWKVTSHIRPATYLASAVIEPDGRGLTLGEAEVKSWQEYHVDLARDPRMTEVASERFRQRGIISLGSAPELNARLTRDMSVQAQADGGVVVELRGKGAEKTERELDTFITALASVANASREGRADGAATVVSQPAEAGEEPVADDRLMFATGAAGGGLVASMLLGVVAWARLTRAKKQYESDVVAAQAQEPGWDGPGAGPAIRKAGPAKKPAAAKA